MAFVHRILMRNDSGEDVLYCDYEYDSDAARYDVLALTASASLQRCNTRLLAKKVSPSAASEKQ